MTLDIGTRLDFIEKMHNKVKCNFLLVAYRGYSLSEGFPSESGIKEDGIAIMDYIFSRTDVIDTQNVFVLGRSLGGAVAVHCLASSKFPVRGRTRLNSRRHPGKHFHVYR